MRQKMITEKNSDVSPKEVANLRESVGWGRNEEIYPEVLKRHSAYFTSRNSAGKLIGYVSVLSDEVADPPGVADTVCIEQLIRLPNGHHCYQPPEDAPEIGPLPITTNRVDRDARVIGSSPRRFSFRFSWVY